ncbi:hypothetical protein S58_11310 [Bradyrhizobium oligotrophicum S58]|uniref:Uncharacterized protein n=1 Tax=Bradyrhizobium oligotrophicum S58 TaxID=1245469 RepID=M4Z2Z2_9BRAD|nr:hypothetical protein S58_11310 [Bradyrhizobium oligotrophicum S58]
MQLRDSDILGMASIKRPLAYRAVVTAASDSTVDNMIRGPNPMGTGEKEGAPFHHAYVTQSTRVG